MDNSILMYSSHNCGYCDLAKKLLNEKGIQFKEINIQVETEKRDEMLQDKKIFSLLEKYIDKNIYSINRKDIYKFKAECSQHWLKNKTILLGGAAYQLPPFGYQSLNSEIRDINNLCWKLSLVLKNKCKPDILLSYNAEREPVAKETISSSLAMGQLIDSIAVSFKKNIPYDQLVTWQIAGDLFQNPTREQKLATAFNRNSPMTAEGGAIDEEWRLHYVFDRTETLSTAFLGLTVACAKCHDHKFDPISQKTSIKDAHRSSELLKTGDCRDPSTHQAIYQRMNGSTSTDLPNAYQHGGMRGTVE